MLLLTKDAKVWLDNVGVMRTFQIWKAGSAMKHAASDDVTLRQATIRALNAPLHNYDKVDEGGGVFRCKINSGLGRLVYKVPADPLIPDSAKLFHYHWNYKMDDPMTTN